VGLPLNSPCDWGFATFTSLEEIVWAAHVVGGLSSLWMCSPASTCWELLSFWATSPGFCQIYGVVNSEPFNIDVGGIACTVAGNIVSWFVVNNVDGA
jgi:hypothetical protein